MMLMESARVLWNHFDFNGIYMICIESLTYLRNRIDFIDPIRFVWNQFDFHGINIVYMESSRDVCNR